MCALEWSVIWQFVLSVGVGTIAIWIAASMASVSDATFGKAVFAAVASNVTVGLIAWYFAEASDGAAATVGQ